MPRCIRRATRLCCCATLFSSSPTQLASHLPVVAHVRGEGTSHRHVCAEVQGPEVCVGRSAGLAGKAAQVQRQQHPAAVRGRQEHLHPAALHAHRLPRGVQVADGHAVQAAVGRGEVGVNGVGAAHLQAELQVQEAA
jgi:hypothetical protein